MQLTYYGNMERRAIMYAHQATHVLWEHGRWVDRHSYNENMGVE